MFTVKINWNKTKLSKRNSKSYRCIKYSYWNVINWWNRKFLDSINDLDVVGHRVVHGWKIC